jgi:AMMECR1 domain-containing protein
MIQVDYSKSSRIRMTLCIQCTDVKYLEVFHPVASLNYNSDMRRIKPKLSLRFIIIPAIAVISALFLSIGCEGKNSGIKKAEQDLREQAASLALLPADLMEQAHKAVVEGFGTPIPQSNELIPAGSEELGIFVRFRTETEERGCFTFYRGVDGPAPWISAAARNAAFADVRYPHITRGEKDVIMEVAVIGELTPMKGPEDFQPGFHTIFLRLNKHQAILQAPIALQRDLDKEDFLMMLAGKAGLDPMAWTHPDAVLLKAPTIWAQGQFTSTE